MPSERGEEVPSSLIVIDVGVLRARDTKEAALHRGGLAKPTAGVYPCAPINDP
eukprot:CAMPEP_0204493610 /NCGR_PEP_ID=MMETSP0471-20130131/82476_1 /ASSEMBLY_ACC=CAM_ASM_000602 /TAXON_ID=2969 /ORGANISM="Oxyrrhis marina" /LENGTH=52 /DNA_ID=CAMNT_0051497749 /DNA_START=185 /DNA_END=340 /DNA_ORIENTATION=+